MADWVQALGQDYQDYYNTLNPNQQQRAKRKYKKTGTPWYAKNDGSGGTQMGTDPYTAGQAEAAGTGSGALEANQGRAVQAGGRAPRDYRAPDQFRNDINDQLMHATPGSFAAGIHAYDKTPDALNYYADNPYALYGAMGKDRFGVPAGGRAQGVFADYLNPREKAYGMLGDYPSGSLEWVNFGEALFGKGGSPNGTFLDPRSMVQNIVQTLMDETANMAKGGQGPGGDEWNPLRNLINLDPGDGLQGLLGILEGALKGTMPDDDLRSYLAYVEMAGQAYASDYGRGSSPGLFDAQAKGDNWLTALVRQLGPTLGL
jgi:hypothetical protein